LFLAKNSGFFLFRLVFFFAALADYLPVFLGVSLLLFHQANSDECTALVADKADFSYAFVELRDVCWQR